jgi:hypothetical protein
MTNSRLLIDSTFFGEIHQQFPDLTEDDIVKLIPDLED